MWSHEREKSLVLYIETGSLAYIHPVGTGSVSRTPGAPVAV
jgi:hypothetical protein